MQTIRIAGIVPESIVDGIGIRFTLFTQGCPHKCKGCHNQHTWDCNGGKTYTVDELAEQINTARYITGVTFTGGEPFIQAESLVNLAVKIKLPIWCYTGYTWETIINSAHEPWLRLLNQIDVLVDGPYVESERDLDLPFKGSRNQRTIDVQQSLAVGEVVLYDLEAATKTLRGSR